ENLNVPSMLRKRVGTPRSRISRMPHTATSSSASTYPMRTTPRSRELPKLSAIAAVKYAPPAMPPRKKYQTISRCQPGVLSTVSLLSAALAEGHHRADADHEGGADRQQGIDQDVALGQERFFRQVVRRRLVEQKEERVQPAERAVRVGAVELGAVESHLLE